MHTTGCPLPDRDQPADRRGAVRRPRPARPRLVRGLAQRPSGNAGCAEAVGVVRPARPTWGSGCFVGGALHTGIDRATPGDRVRDWNRILTKLRRTKLVEGRDPTEPSTVSVHPLVREYFGGRLRETNAAAWCAGHDRLYEYFKNSAEEFPATLPAMVPLYAAVYHGCQAGRHQDAFDAVFWRRIQRGDQAYDIYQLGAYGECLAAGSNLRKALGPPRRRPEAGRPDVADQRRRLPASALGRLDDATQPMLTALRASVARGDWRKRLPRRRKPLRTLDRDGPTGAGPALR